MHLFNKLIFKFILIAVISLAVIKYAAAEDTSGQLDITVGINEAMSVICDIDLDFGLITVRSGNRGGASSVALNRSNNDLNISGNAQNVSTTTGTAGECTLYGSGASDGSTITVTFDDADISLGKNDASSNAPTSALQGLSVGSFTVTSEPDLTQDDNGLNDGSAPFNIGGTLTIPDEVPRDAIGDHIGTVTITVSDEV